MLAKEFSLDKERRALFSVRGDVDRVAIRVGAMRAIIVLSVRARENRGVDRYLSAQALLNRRRDHIAVADEGGRR